MGFLFLYVREETWGLLEKAAAGKPLLCHCILGLLDQDEWETEGSILFEGHRIIAGKDGVRPGFCGTAAGFIAQDPAGAFDPRMTLMGTFSGNGRCLFTEPSGDIGADQQPF